MELVIHNSADDVADAASSFVAGAISGSSTRFSLGLAGGSTPEEAYRRLRSHDVDWSSVDAWLADERWVAHDSDRSNGRMADSSLFRFTTASFHRPRWEADLAPDDSAAEYGRLLRNLHEWKPGPDLVLLGLGADGHTASLFPGSTALDETHHWYVANTVPETGEIRLTATYPFLQAAALTLFLVVGQSKARALEASLDGRTPAGALGDGPGTVLWFVDEEAASLVT